MSGRKLRQGHSKTFIHLHKRTKNDPLLDRAKKHGCDPHDIPMKHYFDVAAGMRGSDEGHRAASEHFRKIAPLMQTPDGRLKVAEEGLRIAEEAREKLAEILGCQPKNIFFGNSATRTLLPVFLALSVERSYWFLANPSEYSSPLQLLRKPSKKLSRGITKQNFGEYTDSRDILRTFNDLGSLGEFRHELEVYPYTGVKDELWEKLAREKPFIYYRCLINRAFGGFDSSKHFSRFYPRLLELNPDSILITDASHALGSIDFPVQPYGDIVMMGSSKALGAEPTLGICYVNDRILQVMERELLNRGWPRIAFQFSPETKLGMHAPEEASASRYWISLPELYSLNQVIKNLDMEERMKRLYYLEALVQDVLEFFARSMLIRLQRIRKCDYRVNNFSIFTLERKKLERDLGKLLKPYKIDAEQGDRHDIENAHHTPSLWPYRGYTWYRISWSHEHTPQDVIGLGRKMAAAFEKALGKGWSERFEMWLSILGIEKRYFQEDVKEIPEGPDYASVIWGIAAYHRKPEFRLAALEKCNEEWRFIELIYNTPYLDTKAAVADKYSAMLKDGRIMRSHEGGINSLIATYSSNDRVRSEALECYRKENDIDMAILERIIRETPYEDTRELAKAYLEELKQRKGKTAPQR